MLKNIITALILILLIVGGIGYAIYSDPERPKHQLFAATIKSFVNQAEQLELAFSENNSLPVSEQQLNVELKDKQGKIYELILDMKVREKTITLEYQQEKVQQEDIQQKDNPLAGQTIVLRPALIEDQVYWKCIDGSVLIRYRTRACRISPGFTFESVKKGGFWK